MRRKKWLKLNKTFFLFCEWESEICYFNEYKWISWCNIRKIEKIKTLSSSSINKLNFSRKSLYIKTWYSLDNFQETKSKIFILIDLDRYSKEEINFIKSKFEDENITIITSNLDFELWVLLHFDLHIKESWNYTELINKIYWKKYKKWEAFCNIKFYREIIGNKINVAYENAKKLEKLNESQWKIDLKEKLPYTEIYKIIDELKS